MLHRPQLVGREVGPIAIRPGRNELESVNRPIVCGGVLIMPGDVVVADGDGVVVVPRAKDEAVAKYARKILYGEQAGRLGANQRENATKIKRYATR